MLAVELYRSVPRYLAAKAVGGRMPGLLAGPVAPLRLVDLQEPEPPAPGWVKVKPLLSGICGSDLNTISGKSSFYFSSLVSMPFVPGHEVVGELDDGGGRVVLDPVLACAARGIDPACTPCLQGESARCERITGGHVGPGLQTGYCHDTGGGWSEMLIAHNSQLHPIPDDLPDEGAVMVEPMACAAHAARRAQVPRDATVLITGAGTVGLLTLVAVRELTSAGRVIVAAKHSNQAEIARRFGASEVVSPRGALGAVRRTTRAFRADPERSDPFLLGGVDVAFECVGSRSSLDLALRSTRAGGKVVMSGMPEGADLSPAWFRELEVVGAYSGAGCFEEAIEMVADSELAKLISATYPLSSWRNAIDHALSAGSLGAIKIAFDPRLDG